jgi:hypothetical protein
VFAVCDVGTESEVLSGQYYSDGKHISAAVNHHATIEEVVFSMGAAPGLYNEDLRQLRNRTEGDS